MDRLLSVLNLSSEATAVYSGTELKILFANEGMRAVYNKEGDVIGKPAAA